MEERVERLEALVALQDRSLEKLNEVLSDQQLEISELKRQVKLLAGKVRELRMSADEQIQDVPPPHYNG
ncbi:SlyX family protein [Pseudodesulfovibrio tunisiensis]|uniref:SlyX family protein n=1 Tax=Pseudodesulfovibrio tunisiensis TaxID=463192 RepID=UPI001FB4C3FD|nr:SlyX family protein [Pseudodesulfovibrio tunisiensis]